MQNTYLNIFMNVCMVVGGPFCVCVCGEGEVLGDEEGRSANKVLCVHFIHK